MSYSPRKVYTKKQPPMAVAKAIAKARAGEVRSSYSLFWILRLRSARPVVWVGVAAILGGGGGGGWGEGGGSVVRLVAASSALNRSPLRRG